MRLAERRAEGGAAAVEFALVVVPFVMLVFGIISFGILFAQQLALGNAARDGARSAVVETRNCGQVKTIARNAAQTIRMSSADVVVSVARVPATGPAVAICGTGNDAVKPCAGSAADDSIEVTVGYRSEIMIPFVVTKDIDIASEGSFRCEFS
jgi:Flp pilus assembly protein TadG